jgi:actin-related protein
VERNVCEKIDLENRAEARHIVVSPRQLDSEPGAARSKRWPNACSHAAMAAFGLLLWLGSGTVGLPVPLDRYGVSQPTAARAPLPQPSHVLAGLIGETLDRPASDTRAERAERRKVRKEAAQAKREAARERRATTAAERHEASQAKHEAARERYAAAKQARLEAAEERKQASEEKHDAAREQYAAKKQARLEVAEERKQASDSKHEAAREQYAAKKQARVEAAEARREAARQKHEMAHARRESGGSGSGESEAAPASFGSSASASSGTSGGIWGSGNAGSGNAGILRINSLPWAQVFVDGRLVGYTPQRSISLTPGDHDVRLVNPAFAMSKTLHVKVAQGQQVTRSEILEE